MALPGDFNNDNVVDAADYTLWRDNVGDTAGTLPNDVDGGTIRQVQYDTWKAGYGSSIGGGSLSTIAVPEPSSGTLCMLAAACTRASGSRILSQSALRMRDKHKPLSNGS